MRVGFTATRDTSIDDVVIIERRLYDIREEFDVTEITTGGAVGGDQIIALKALQLWPYSYHRLVLPESWDSKFIKEFTPLKGEILFTGLEPLSRNQVILHFTDHLEAFPKTNENVRRSGTWATIRYAKGRNISHKINGLKELREALVA